LRFWASQAELAKSITGYSVDDESTIETIRAVWNENGYLADPHTAVGLNAALSYRKDTGDVRPIVVLSTAHPAKFPETMLEATGERIAEPERLSRVGLESTQRDLISADLETVLKVIRAQHQLFDTTAGTS
jgi:threonine synthase